MSSPSSSNVSSHNEEATLEHLEADSAFFTAISGYVVDPSGLSWLVKTKDDQILELLQLNNLLGFKLGQALGRLIELREEVSGLRGTTDSVTGGTINEADWDIAGPAETAVPSSTIVSTSSEECSDELMPAADLNGGSQKSSKASPNEDKEQELDTDAPELPSLHTEAPEMYPVQSNADEITSTKSEDTTSESIFAPIADNDHTPTTASPSEKGEELEAENLTTYASAQVSEVPREAMWSEYSPDEEDFPALGSGTVNRTTEMVFATPETLRNVPPAPLANKLTTAINTNGYSKAATKAELEKSQRGKKRTNSGPKKNERPAKTDAVPKIDLSQDIRSKSLQDRVLFGNGRDITVMLGSKDMGTAPQYMLMQCSALANDHFTENPDAVLVSLPADSMDAAALAKILKWMNEILFSKNSFSIRLANDPEVPTNDKDRENLEVCRAARDLGLNKCYVGHFTFHFCDRIRKELVTESLVSLVCDILSPINDSIFDFLVGNLAERRLSGEIKKSHDEGFDYFLRGQTQLFAAIFKKQEQLVKEQVKTKGAEDKKKAKLEANVNKQASNASETQGDKPKLSRKARAKANTKKAKLEGGPEPDWLTRPVIVDFQSCVVVKR